MSVTINNNICTVISQFSSPRKWRKLLNYYLLESALCRPDTWGDLDYDGLAQLYDDVIINKSNQANYIIVTVRPKVDQIAGQLSLPHVG